MIEKNIVSFETAENLLKLGFNEPCEYYYSLTDSDDKEVMRYGSIGVANDELQDGILHYPAMSAPLLSQVLIWIKDKGMYFTMYYNHDKSMYSCWMYIGKQLVAVGDKEEAIDAIMYAIGDTCQYLYNEQLRECHEADKNMSLRDVMLNFGDCFEQ